jgi:hypothetical protein
MPLCTLTMGQEKKSAGSHPFANPFAPTSQDRSQLERFFDDDEGYAPVRGHDDDAATDARPPRVAHGRPVAGGRDDAADDCEGGGRRRRRGGAKGADTLGG